MRERLWEMMGDMDVIGEKLHDIRNLMQMQKDYGQDAGWDEMAISVFSAQVTLLEKLEQLCEELHTKMDDTVLDLVHGRIEVEEKDM